MDIAYKTAFAPAARASSEQNHLDYIKFDTNEIMAKALNSFPNIVLVLNEHRQIVYFNKPLLTALELDDESSILGLRPGELFNCLHATETEGGCGTTEACQFCGAVLAILASQEGKSETRECRLTAKRDNIIEALDLQVHAANVVLNEHAFTFFSIVDISSEKRRQILERIFFHDVLNTASAIKGTIDLLNMGNSSRDDAELLSLLPIVSQRLINEVKSQQELLQAEKGELVVQNKPVSSLRILHDIVNEYEHANFVTDRFMEVAPDALDIIITTDETLLKRVLSNMLKNALEASVQQDKIIVGNKIESDNTIAFYVQNPQCMSDEVRLQIFNRSFSTKGAGRGLGTYSIKLLTERYLKGKVGFTTDKENGTVFWVRLNKG